MQKSLTFKGLNLFKFLFFLLTLLLISNLFPQVVIKSLKTFTTSAALLPVVTEGERLKISFDVQSEFAPNLSIVFRYCDKQWNPYDNMFLQNHGQNIAYDLDLRKLPSTVEDADYHFRGAFPDNEGFVSFPFSGKWKFFITDAHDTSRIFAEGKFFVVYPEIELDVKLKNVLLEDKTYYPLELGRAYEITASFDLPENMYPSFVSETEIIENQKIDYPFIIDKTFNTNTRQFYWNGSNKFSLTARDVRPGNEYRQTDLRNHNVFIGKDVNARVDGIEISRFFQPGGRDNNGSSIFMNYRNDYATYLNVQFKLRPPPEIMGDIFLVGSFNNWKLLPEYKMENSAGLYTKTITLKRGVYDYQYVTADVINGSINNENWIALEGNFWETNNDYYIFVYYNDPDYGGYDRIIGFKRISSRQ